MKVLQSLGISVVENGELLWTPQRPEFPATNDVTELELLIGE
jgi:hypothetical protein